MPNATFPTYKEVDIGEITLDNNSVDNPFTGLGELRLFSDQLLERITEIEFEDADLQREISLRYDFTSLLRKARVNTYVRRLSFTLSARNIWTSTSYSGADPEVNFRGSRDQARAQDFLTLPSPRVIYGTISIGL